MTPFLHPAFAWAALGLASIPVIIHLLNRQRQRKLDWAAMEFLLKALKRTRRRVRIEQLLLLLLRMAIMALIGLFLARPMLSEEGLGLLASALRSEHRIFVVDDSLSVSRREAGRLAFDRATETLSHELTAMAGSRRQDRLTVLRSSRPEAPIEEAGLVSESRAREISATLSGMRPTSTRLHIARTLESIAEKSASYLDASSRLPRTVSILTDLRASDWTDGTGGPVKAISDALDRVKSSTESPARVLLFDVGSDETANLAITGVSLESRPTVGLPAQVSVRVRNFGRATVDAVRVQIRYGPVAELGASEGRSLESAPASTAIAPPIAQIAPGESELATFSCTFRTPGEYWAEVTLTGADDALSADNRYSLVIDVAASTRVLLVTGEPSSESWEDETYYLSLALRPGDDATSGVEPVVVVDDSLPSGALDEFDAVFLANVYSLPEDFRLRLGRWVRTGGSLVIFLGDQVDPVVYERDFGVAAGALDEAHPSRELLPAKLGELLGTTLSEVGLAPSYDHPFFEFLRDGGEPYVEDIRFDRFFSLEPHADARVIARFAGEVDLPAIVERAAGDGRVVLFATSADREWSNWPRNVTYLMVLQRAVETLARGRARSTERLAGEPIRLPIDIARHDTEARVRGPQYPSAPEVRLRAVQDADDPQGTFTLALDRAATLDAGHFLIGRRARGGGETEWSAIAVRSDAAESDLARIDESELRRLYPEADLRVVRDEAALGESSGGRFEASDLLLGALVLALLAEGLLACYLARHRRREEEGLAVTQSRFARLLGASGRSKAESTSRSAR